jgi:site-specific DNA-cytosine methylase
MVNCLELFSGGHSFKKVADTLGYNTISLDIKKYKNVEDATHIEDILTWDYKKYPKNYFNIVWASPPCVYYSTLQNCWIGQYKRDENNNKYLFTRDVLNEKRKLADEWVKKTIEIIKYFNPQRWYIENPTTGQLKNRGLLDDYNYYDVDYCKYSTCGYRKRTRIWTNVKDFIPLICNKDCNNLDENNKHLKNVSKIKSSDGTRILLRYRIPPKLILYLLNSNP